MENTHASACAQLILLSEVPCPTNPNTTHGSTISKDEEMSQQNISSTI
jgi:hypothetical protein